MPWRRCWSAACRRVRRPLRRDGGLANRGAATDIPWTADPHGRDPMAADDNPDPQTRTELEAAAFRTPVAHLRAHPEVQNIDRMKPEERRLGNAGAST